MANFLYNGVLFPALPVAEYQYTFILHKTGSTYWAYYFANASDFYTQSVDGMVRAVSGVTVLRSTINTSGTNAWSTPVELSDVTSITSYQNIIWANTPILDENGEVYLAASDPIPVSEHTIHPKSYMMGFLMGQKVRGMLRPRERQYSYNGTVLPSLPVWDRVTYPYAYMMKNSSGVVSLICSPEPFKYGTLTTPSGEMTWVYILVEAGGTKSVTQTKITDGEWGEPSVITKDNSEATIANAIYLQADLFWANTDIPNVDDGTIYLAASRPVLVP